MSTEKNPVDQWQSAFGGASETEEALSPATEESDGVVRAEESKVDEENPGETEDTLSSDLSANKGPASPEAKKQTTSEKEVITVTDDQGRKRKIEVDYSNREAIKKAHLQAAGMRKFQAERDHAIQSGKAKEARLGELETNFSALDNAYQAGGIEGLFDLLEGQRGAFKAHVAKQVDRAKFLERASPEDIEQLNAREEYEKAKKDLDRLKKDNEDFKKKVTEERETAELKETQSRVYPSFERHRFADKLGSAENEGMFDEMLWNTALKRLKPYEAQGLELSPELIDREFRTVAASIRKSIGLQADKQVSKVVQQKKQEATENVQAKVKSGYTNKSDTEKLRQHLKNGDTGSIFKNWSSFKDILSNRK